MKKRLEELEEGPEVKIPLDSLRATLKNIPNWNMPSHDSGLKNSRPSKRPNN